MNTKDLRQKAIDESRKLLGSILLASILFGAAVLLSYGTTFLYRAYRLHFASIEAQTEKLTAHQAPVIGKDAGFLAGGYAVKVEIAGKEESVYVSQDKFLSVGVGDKECIKYQRLDGQNFRFRFCGDDRDE